VQKFALACTQILLLLTLLLLTLLVIVNIIIINSVLCFEELTNQILIPCTLFLSDIASNFALPPYLRLFCSWFVGMVINCITTFCTAGCKRGDAPFIISYLTLWSRDRPVMVLSVWGLTDRISIPTRNILPFTLDSLPDRHLSLVSYSVHTESRMFAREKTVGLCLQLERCHYTTYAPVSPIRVLIDVLNQNGMRKTKAARA
jgi:hypothetical protein